MKKLTILIFSVIFSVALYGQEVADQLLSAKALISRGETEKAISMLGSAISGQPDYRLYLQRAEAYLMAGDYSGALSDYNEANNLNSGSGEYGLSRIYALKGDVETSLYHLERNIGSNWKKSEKDIMLDPAFGAVENKAGWKSFWKKERYTELERKISEVEFYASSARPDEAKAISDELKAGYPDNDAVSYAEALYYNSAHKPSEAIRSITPLIGKYPGNEKYLRVLAKAQEETANSAGLTDTYSRMLDSGVTDAGVLLKRAMAYRKTGENDKALADIQKYLSFYPSDMNALSMQGKTMAASGDNLRALELFSRNLSLHPEDPQCYIDRADSYFVSRTWDRAIDDYSMSLDLKPGNPEAWLNKGIALLNTARKQEACHDFRKALSLGNKKASEYISRNCIK
ncbi:MAG TPA: tetratricopeptide repeat protein [Bacteroidales bacterium]|jgi:Flp pilus assembly protein TadD|nr:tetratricopeptide repeat protein [Bacteroidales bacterium]